MNGVPMVFINFRGQDQAGYAALLDRELTKQFGAGSVFLSSRSILPGEDFEAEIRRNLKLCTVLLAVIGPHWLSYTDPANRKGTNTDWVQLEIAEALTGAVRVIPILVEDAKMPAYHQLPAEIAELSLCQYLRLHHRSIGHDLSRVVQELARFLPNAPRSPSGQHRAAQRQVRRHQLVRPQSPCRIGVVTGSIRNVRSADIWVNSENTDMYMSRYTDFSVSAVIRYWGAYRDSAGRVTHDAVDTELTAKVGAKRPLAPGTAVVTGSGALAQSNNVRHIIHVAAVQGEPGAGFRQVRDVGVCVTNALRVAEHLARSDEARTILFPILGAGQAGADVSSTVAALVGAAVDYLTTAPDTALTAIDFLAYTEAERAALDQVLATTPRLSRVG